MGNILDELVNEANAKGEARGRIAALRGHVAKGRLSVDAARVEIEELIATQVIPEATGREALGQLG